MTEKEFQQRLHSMEKEFKEFFNTYGPTIAGNVAVSLFKQNFQTESFFGEKWQEVKRRLDAKNFRTVTRGKRKGQVVATRAAGRRKILTGETGDLGRSIKIKAVVPGRAVIWSDPAAFGSKQPYGAVHNEGLKAGRGKGFIMPRRQFIGDAPALRQAVAGELDRKIKEIIHNQRQ